MSDSDTHLYIEYNALSKHGIIANTTMPDYIESNLKFDIRPYQEEAFKRFIFYMDTKKDRAHLLFNMATGSGKTLIMAGLILYLYDKGYRNFLFFVNNNNIIKKTKDNFLNPQAIKYLYKNNPPNINEVKNFNESIDENINIKFTTIQQLHTDINNPKENSITINDFEDDKTVLIADEAHHLSAASKNKDLFEETTWENTVNKIYKANDNNILLEFTATIDYDNPEIKEKYRDKVIYKYDLKQFREDKFSKEINLIRSEYEEEDRIIQSLILNLYREKLAADNGINLKPVILFKAKRTVAESENNKIKFHTLIEDLSSEKIENIKNTSSISIVQNAFNFLIPKMSYKKISDNIQENFKKENCLSANKDIDIELQQIRLNTLEDIDNPIRAVFAVKKLNEGWDVLNLFDIVRLYEGRDDKQNKPGKTTISEAQLIGRGARYFPFVTETHQDKYTRKYDKDINNDLKILEELYYHTREDSLYIVSLKKRYKI